MRFTLAGLLSLTLAGVAFACAWDSNTLEDELALEGNVELFDLITGQFPHHGQAFYENQLAQSKAKLVTQPKDWAARDDAAVALMKLERFEESRVALEGMLADDPGRYETLSNLGVLHKKTGEFAKAADYMQRALAIKPEGHMGLGDWYLRMLRYQERAAAGNVEGTFLGGSYGEIFPEAALPKDEVKRLGRSAVGKQFLLAMIRNDRAFPDTYALLGRYLRNWEMKPSLALWCFVRAKQLGHPNQQHLDEEIAATFSSLREHAENDGGDNVVGAPDDVVAAIEADLERAQEWLVAFQALEAERVDAKVPSAFADVLKALAAKGVKPLRPQGHAVVAGGKLVARTTLQWTVVGLVALFVGLGAVVLLRGLKRLLFTRNDLVAG